MTGLHLLRRAWAPEVMLALAVCPQRFNWMLANIPGISDRVLTERLRDMEDVGLVTRTVRVAAKEPVAVWYQLTDEAQPFVPPLRALAALHALRRVS